MNNYILNKNIEIITATEKDIELLLNFQNSIINEMPNKEFFKPLTKEEFLKPIKEKDNVYILKHNNEIIGLFVATCNIDDLLEEYKLKKDNYLLIDSIMIKKEYRGSKLQKQILKYLYNKAKEMNINYIVATVHPNNIYSLNNFIEERYKKENLLTIHGGPRYIMTKRIEKTI